MITICVMVITMAPNAHAGNTVKSVNTRFVAEMPALMQTPYIPKPDTLPGPPESVQAGETSDSQNNIRRVLIDTLIPKLTVLVTGLAAGLAFLFLVIGGVRFATSYGNDQLIESAKKQIMYALIGLVLAIMSYVIITIIINLKIFQS